MTRTAAATCSNLHNTSSASAALHQRAPRCPLADHSRSTRGAALRSTRRARRSAQREVGVRYKRAWGVKWLDGGAERPRIKNGAKLSGPLARASSPHATPSAPEREREKRPPQGVAFRRRVRRIPLSGCDEPSSRVAAKLCKQAQCPLRRVLGCAVWMKPVPPSCCPA